MISEQAKAGFDQLLSRALLRSAGTADDAATQVAVLDGMPEFPETNVVALTISSYLVKLMVMIYFTPQQASVDAIGESANLCCGILNRDLSVFFPHIGMSTPNILFKQSALHLQSLPHSHLQHFRVATESGKFIHATLCVFAYDAIDFTVDHQQQPEETGELELF
ncbi:MAG: hypothetical protein V4724_06720 [Pseudomonadota bacterium]